MKTQTFLHISIRTDSQDSAQELLNDLEIDLKNDKIKIIPIEDDFKLNSDYNSVVQILIDLSEHPITSGLAVLLADKLYDHFTKKSKKSFLQINNQEEINLQPGGTSVDKELARNKIKERIKEGLKI